MLDNVRQDCKVEAHAGERLIERRLTRIDEATDTCRNFEQEIRGLARPIPLCKSLSIKFCEHRAGACPYVHNGSNIGRRKVDDGRGFLFRCDRQPRSLLGASQYRWTIGGPPVNNTPSKGSIGRSDAWEWPACSPTCCRVGPFERVKRAVTKN